MDTPKMLWYSKWEKDMGVKKCKKVIAKAAIHYEKKYGLLPNAVETHGAVPKAVIENLNKAENITVIRRTNLPVGHYTISHDGSTSNQEEK